MGKRSGIVVSSSTEELHGVAVKMIKSCTF